MRDAKNRLKKYAIYTPIGAYFPTPVMQYFNVATFTEDLLIEIKKAI
jgi:hypothetical protein